MSTRTPRIRFDAQLMAEDAARKGWNDRAFAREAGVSPMVVSRFFSGLRQTAPSAEKLARALGRPLSRYVIPKRRAA